LPKDVLLVFARDSNSFENEGIIDGEIWDVLNQGRDRYALIVEKIESTTRVTSEKSASMIKGQHSRA